MSLVTAPTGSAPDSGRRPEDGQKFRQILDGARAVFLADGFDAASMNEIAKAAGVSKGTLYVYFASKDELFAELIRDEKREQAEQTCRLDMADTDVAGVLAGFGVRLLDRIFRPAAIAHLRTVAAVAPRFPAIGAAFYEAGPQYGHTRLSEYLARHSADGLIAIDDPHLAAVLFIDMCKSMYLLPVLLCVAEPPSPETIRDHVGRVVAMFLRAYPLRAGLPGSPQRG